MVVAERPSVRQPTPPPATVSALLDVAVGPEGDEPITRREQAQAVSTSAASAAAALPVDLAPLPVATPSPALLSSSPSSSVSGSEGAESDADTSVEVEAEESITDDIRDAMTKTALCTTLFAFTRANRLPLNFANALSKAMCSSSQTLREFEHLRNEIELMEREASLAQPPKPRRTFFGLRKATPSPLEVAKQKTETMMQNWLRVKMEQMVAQHPTTADGGGAQPILRRAHSSSTPNLQLLSSASHNHFGLSSSLRSHTTMMGHPPQKLSSSMSFSTGPTLSYQPIQTSQMRPGRQSSGVSSPGQQSSPVTPSRLHHASSLSGTFSIPNGASVSPVPSGSSTPTGSAGVNNSGPRKMWRTMFSSSGTNLAATFANAAQASIQPITTAQPQHATHFDSFPRLNEILSGLVGAPVPDRALKWMHGRMTVEEIQTTGLMRRDGDVTLPHLVLHPCFPASIPTPLDSIHLSESEFQSEQEVSDAWTDVLVNYRKHVAQKKMRGTPPECMWRWWRDMWREVETRGESWNGEEQLDISPSPKNAEGVPAAASVPPVVVVPQHSTELSGRAALSPLSLAALQTRTPSPPPASSFPLASTSMIAGELSSLHVRLLLSPATLDLLMPV